MKLDLYLLRHADASTEALRTSSYHDDRPLSEQGKKKMRETAVGLRDFIEPPEYVVASPLARAWETAEIVRDVFAIDSEILIHPAILPESEINFAELLQERFSKAHSLLLVGHEPKLSRQLAVLLGCSDVCWFFKKCGIAKVHLEREQALLEWFIPGKIFRR